MTTQNKNHLIESLKNGIVHLIFEKVNGETRIMNATLNFDLIDMPKAPNYEERPAPDGVVTVWDVDCEGWRRFKAENLISYESKN